MEVKSEFEKLPHRRGYGIVSLIDREVMDSVMQSIDWEKSSFKSTNGALNLRTDLIQKIIWDNMPETVRKLAQNPLQVAMESV
tara:strand:- start:296 stop:544 length:249 start_codon:yes stop_codon:yes gene_type:complete